MNMEDNCAKQHEKKKEKCACLTDKKVMDMK